MSASVNYPLRRPLAEFMRPLLEEVSRLLWRLRHGVGTTRTDRSLAIGEFYTEQLHWQLGGTLAHFDIDITIDVMIATYSVPCLQIIF